MTRREGAVRRCLRVAHEPWSYPQGGSLRVAQDPQTSAAAKSLGVIWNKSGGHLNKSGGHPCPPTVFTNHYQPRDIPALDATHDRARATHPAAARRPTSPAAAQRSSPVPLGPSALHRHSGASARQPATSELRMRDREADHA